MGGLRLRFGQIHRTDKHGIQHHRGGPKPQKNSNEETAHAKALSRIYYDSILVADVSNRFYAIDSIDARAQFTAQAADVIIDATIENGELPTEHLLKELFARNNFARLLQQNTQEIEFGGRQFDDFTGTADDA
jgi:hypothetical protein